MRQEKLDEIVKRMRSFGDMLVPYNFPKKSQQDEEDINVLKSCDATVDGYDVVLHYSKNDYDSHVLETFQALGQRMPFLPFHLVCKLARQFLGGEHLSLIELFRDNRKIYVWTKKSRPGGQVMPSEYAEDAADEHAFEGWRYHYLKPKAVNFY